MSARHDRRRRARAAATAFALLLLPGLLPAMHADAEDLSGYSGAGLYQRFCASCHGLRGLGDGPVAGSLNVMVPDLTRIAARHGGTFPADQVRRIIDGRTVQPPHGSRDMPVWGYEFGVAEAGDAVAGTGPAPVPAAELVGRLLDYVRSMQRK